MFSYLLAEVENIDYSGLESQGAGAAERENAKGEQEARERQCHSVGDLGHRQRV